MTKSFKTTLTLFACWLGTALAMLAADPSGTWHWTVTGPKGREQKFTAIFRVNDGKLSGTVENKRVGKAEIAAAQLKDEQIEFTVVRERRSRKIETHYVGKIAGDTITGTATLEAGSKDRQIDWKAQRAPAK